MQPAVPRSQQFPEPSQKPQSATIVEEAGQALVISLDHVLRDARQVETAKAGRDVTAWLGATHSVRAVTAFGLCQRVTSESEPR